MIDAEGMVETRYQYVGRDGYETFTAMPFIHIGYRWYDPSSGRFLQRDPSGFFGGPNVYEYIESAPSGATDPTGLANRDYHGSRRHKENIEELPNIIHKYLRNAPDPAYVFSSWWDRRLVGPDFAFLDDEPGDPPGTKVRKMQKDLRLVSSLCTLAAPWHKAVKATIIVGTWVWDRWGPDDRIIGEF